MAESTFDASLQTKTCLTASLTADGTTSKDGPLPRIRSADLRDLDQLTEVLASSFYDRTGWLAWFYPLIKLGIQEDLKQRLKLERPRYTCLAVVIPDAAAASPDGSAHGGTLVGTVEMAQRQSWPWQSTSPRYAYISNLAVTQGFRQRGLASQLLAACESLAITWQLDHLYLHVMEDNPGARRLYRRAGFEIFQAEESLAVWLGMQPRRLLLQKRLSVESQGG